MKLTIPKNRMVHLLLVTITVTMIVLFVSMFYMNQSIQKSYDESLDNHNLISEKTALILKNGIEEDINYLKVSALLAAQSEDINKNKIQKILSQLEKNGLFLNLAIINKEGKGFDISNHSVDYSSESYFLESQSGKSVISYVNTEEKTAVPIMVYAVPIIRSSQIIGTLVAHKEIDYAQFYSFEADDKENSFIYIINENKELIASLNQKEKLIHGQTMINGLLYEDYKKDKLMFSEHLKAGNMRENIIVWYQKPLGINNWTVLIGKKNILEPVTVNLIHITKFIWNIILSSIIFLFLLLVISNRWFSLKLLRTIYLDPVTGGTNWYKFRIDVNKILNSRQFAKKDYAVVNFDINRFKIINDSFGHQRGDEVLKEVYYIIKKWIRAGETFTRYSADQFYVLLSFQDEDEIKDRLTDLNNRLHRMKFANTVKFYFGVYFITETIDSIDRMGEFAGIAKQNIKGSSDKIISFFDDDARKKILEEEQIEMSMHDALKNNQFLVYLQPKYALKEEKVSGAEALVRWNNERDNLISPGYFIPIFEKNGFITELDVYMLRNVCCIQKGWLEKGYKPLPVSVNVSRIHFANPHLAEIIRDIVDEYQIPHELIEIELSESAFLQNKQILIQTVTILREYGFLVSMDDFGAGYSSLNSLKDLPLDVVKLDGELFQITEKLERGQTVIRNTISMAKDLNITVVAECIETKEQVEFLCDVGCDMIQGYYYAKPMPANQFEERYLARLK